MANSISNATALWKYIAGHADADDDGNESLTPGAFPELSNVDEHGRWRREPRTLLVHSKVGGSDSIPGALKEMLVAAAGLDSKADAEDAVREMLNTVGKPGRPGAPVRCVVSVSMLTEGWDARTVTHIVGYRAFSTQLLCEQVTGRALRRTSYDAFREPDPNGDGRRLLEAEYADVVGIPFEFMPDMGEPEPPSRPPKPRTRVHTVDRRQALRVAWPQVVEYIRTAPLGRFNLDPARVAPWRPPPSQAPTMAALEGVVGEANIIASLRDDMRRRSATLELAAEIAASVTNPERDGRAVGLGRASLFRSAVAAVRQWAAHPKVGIDDLRPLLADGTRRRAAIDAVLAACDFGTSEPARRARLAFPPVLDTSAIDFETTLAHVAETTNSELSHAACHSRLELDTARVLDAHPRVRHWVRNFQLGWSIPYWRGGTAGAWARYEPDFIAVLDGDTNLIIECKGDRDEKARAAAEYTQDHWIPSVAGTTDLPDHLRSWAYAVVDDPHSIRHQLDLAINQFDKREGRS